MKLRHIEDRLEQLFRRVIRKPIRPPKRLIRTRRKKLSRRSRQGR